MSAFILVAPILPGQSEAWRRFIQQLHGTQYADYQISRRRLGIARERVWLAQLSEGELALFLLEGPRPAEFVSELGASYLPFDRWSRHQLLQLHGVDLTMPEKLQLPALTFEWNDGEEDPEAKEVHLPF